MDWKWLIDQGAFAVITGLFIIMMIWTMKRSDARDKEFSTVVQNHISHSTEQMAKTADQMEKNTEVLGALTETMKDLCRELKPK